MAAGDCGSAAVVEPAREWPLSEREGPGPVTEDGEATVWRTAFTPFVWRIGDVFSCVEHLDKEVMELSRHPDVLMAAEQGPLAGFPLLTRKFSTDFHIDSGPPGMWDRIPRDEMCGIIYAWERNYYISSIPRNSAEVITDIVIELEDKRPDSKMQSSFTDPETLDPYVLVKTPSPARIEFTRAAAKDEKAAAPDVWFLQTCLPMCAFQFIPLPIGLPPGKVIKQMWTRGCGNWSIGVVAGAWANCHIDGQNWVSSWGTPEFTPTGCTKGQPAPARNFSISLGPPALVTKEMLLANDDIKLGTHKVLDYHLGSCYEIGACRFTDGWVNGILPGQTLEYVCRITQRAHIDPGTPLWMKAKQMALAASANGGELSDEEADKIFEGTSEWSKVKCSTCHQSHPHSETEKEEEEEEDEEEEG